MSKYTDRINAGISIALRRQFDSPLDVSTVFKAKADFEAYVLQNTGYSNKNYTTEENLFLQKIIPYSYPGQIIGVIDEGTNTSSVYIINKVGPLEGADDAIEKRYTLLENEIKVDNKTLSKINGFLCLANIPNEITEVLTPSLQTDGSLLWKKVDNSAIEALEDLITALNTRVGALENRVLNIENKYLKSVSYSSSTGIFTFINQNDEVQQFDLAIEKIVKNFEYDPQTESLVLTLEDGSLLSIPLASFIKEYIVQENATQVQLRINDNTKEISATLVDKGIDTIKLSDDVVSNIESGVQAANELPELQNRISSTETNIELINENLNNKLETSDLSELVDNTTIKLEDSKLKVGIVAGSQISGVVGQANSALAADKVVNNLTFGSKTYNGSTPQELLAEDIEAANKIHTHNTTDITNLDSVVNSLINTELKKHPGIDKIGTVTSIEAGDGLIISNDPTINPKISLNTVLEFILNCGDSNF